MSVGEMVLDDFVSGVEIENILPQNFAVGAANSETQGGFTLSLLSEINSHQNQINDSARHCNNFYLIISQKEKKSIILALDKLLIGAGECDILNNICVSKVFNKFVSQSLNATERGCKCYKPNTKAAHRNQVNNRQYQELDW